MSSADHPDVGDVAVVGVPDATWGEEVAAVIRPAAGITETPDPEGSRLLPGALAGYKCPRLWFYVTEFPLTPSGKVSNTGSPSMIAEGELQRHATFTRQVSRAARPV